MATTDEKGSGSWDATQWHEVKKGETLWKIAEQYYGDGSLHTKIFEANKDTLKDPNFIRVTNLDRDQSTVRTRGSSGVWHSFR